MTIAEKILLYRAKNNLSQREFAELCGTYQPYISEIETGARIPGKMLEIKINLLCDKEGQENG
jgi:transcriptional regulator with XRE-family HTH domain